jgi:hypothetical protein
MRFAIIRREDLAASQVPTDLERLLDLSGADIPNATCIFVRHAWMCAVLFASLAPRHLHQLVHHLTPAEGVNGAVRSVFPQL